MIPRLSPDYTSWIFECLLKPEVPASVSDRIDRHFKVKPTLFRYGRTGLYLLMKSLLSSSHRNRVILPSYSCVVVANAIQIAGGECVFVDCDKDSFLSSQETLLSAIDDRTCLVMPTHLFGMSVDTAELETTCRSQQVFLLQDCAHSFFAKNSVGQNVADLGDGALFGMNISKLANGVRAGALVVKDQSILSKINSFSSKSGSGSGLWDFCYPRAYALAAAAMFSPALHSIVRWLVNNTAILKSQTDYYDENSIDLPKDFLEPLGFFERKVLARSLDRLDGRVSRRREIAKIYCDVLSQFPELFRVSLRFEEGWTWSHFPVAVDETKREALRHHLEEKFAAEFGIIVDYSISDLNVYRRLGHPSSPRALRLSKQIINFPLTLREGFFPRRQWRQLAADIAAETLGFLR